MIFESFAPLSPAMESAVCRSGCAAFAAEIGVIGAEGFPVCATCAHASREAQCQESLGMSWERMMST